MLCDLFARVKKLNVSQNIEHTQDHLQCVTGGVFHEMSVHIAG